MQLSRREFLIAANAAALLALIESCVPGASRVGATPVSGGTPYERALLLLRDAVRASPDHLAQRSTDLVAARDANKIVEFVRDRVAVVPPFSFLEDHRTARRWGSAATLRGGQGTLRDRSEVLADMLTRGGFPAKVMTADRPSAIGLSALYRPRAVPFAPDQKRIDAAAATLHQAGVPAATPLQVFDPGPDPVAAILGALPSALQKVQLRPDLLPDKVPVVAFADGGKQRYAYALGDLAITDTAPAGLGTAPDADSPPMVKITVSAVANPAPGSSTPRGKLIDLVSAAWAADAVVGRQVLLTFMPAQGPKALLQSHLSALPVRIPILRLQTEAPASSTSAGLAVAGPMITVRGDQFPPAGGNGGDLAGPFGTIHALSDSDRKAAVARASSLKATANATAFSEVTLETAVLDGTGSSVDGLDASAFTVKEDGQPVEAFTVLSNARKQNRPRVMIAYDTSGSVLSHWPSTAARAAFEQRLAAAISAASAETSFETQVVGLGSEPDPAGWSAPQTGAIASAMAGVRSGDETWGTIAGLALDQGVVAIVWAGDSSDDDTSPGSVPALQRRLASSGVPVLCVPIGPFAGPSTDKIVSISGGARLDLNDPTTPTKVANLVRPLAAKWIGGAYRLQYVAPANGSARRIVTVGLAGRDQVDASTAYQVPAKPLSPPSFAGLYVTVEVGGLRSVRRLAGIDITDRGNPLGDIDDAAAVAATRAALNGVTTIAIEPGTPTDAALFDDVISSYLSIEPLRPIWNTATTDQLLQAMSKGVRRTPGVLASILSSSGTDPGAVPAFKIAILQERQAGPGLIEQHADLAVGVNPVIAVTADASAGFRSAVATSVAASAAEAATFDDSAYQRLSGRRLQSLAVGDLGAFNSFINTVPTGNQARWTAVLRKYEDFHRLVPAGATSEALWIVAPDTGVAKAILLDGTGGAFSVHECELSGEDIFSLILSAIGLICTIGGPAINPWFCLGVTVLSVVMTVVVIFEEAGSAGTPYGAFATAFGAVGKKTASIGGRLGVAGVVITLTAISLQCG